MSDHTSEHNTAQAAFQRGMLLMERDRPRDAVPFFKQAISEDPQHAMAYAQLAMCWKHEENTKKGALDAIGQAIALEPEEPLFRSFKALILADTASSGDKAALSAALAEAQKGVRLSADTGYSHAVLGYCHLILHDLKEAEASARLALELDPEQTLATQVLAGALLEQNKHEDNADLINYQLQRNPEDPATRVSAGYADLMQGRHQSANEHFREALRLDPENEGARVGLVESFRARNALYRTNLRFSHWIGQFSAGKKVAILIGCYLAYQTLLRIFKSIHPVAAAVIIGIWLAFVFWSYLARGIGGFLMIFDRYARLSLRPKEFWESALVGVLALAAPLLLIGALYHKGLILLAATAFMTSVSLSIAFTTTHYWGKKLYWGLAGVVSLCFLGTLLIFVPAVHSLGTMAASSGILIAVVSTWLVAFSVGR